MLPSASISPQVSRNGLVKWTGSLMPAAVNTRRPVRTLKTPAWFGSPVGTSWSFQYSSVTPPAGSTMLPPTRFAVEVASMSAYSSPVMPQGALRLILPLMSES